MTSRERMNLFWVVVAALAAAYLFRFEPPIRNLIVIGTLIYVGVKLWPDIRSIDLKGWLSAPKRTTPIELPADDHLNTVLMLSLDEAKRRAEAILEVHYELEPPDSADAERTRHLGPSLKELFGEHGLIQSKYGGARLSKAEIEAYQPPLRQLMSFGAESGSPDKRLIQIGSDADGCPILTRPNQDIIHVVRRATSRSDSYWLADYPSIYHWLFMENRDHDA